MNFFSSFFSGISAVQAPNINDIPGFNPSGEKSFIKPNQTAASETLDHWLFTEAVPDWISYLLSFSAAAAVLMVVIGGLMIMMKGEDEEMQTKGTKIILWAIVGLIISVMAYTIVEIVNRIPINESNSNPSVDLIANVEGSGAENLVKGDIKEDIIPDIIKIILSLVGIFAFGLIVYAGALMVMRDNDDEKITKARTLLIYALVGLIVIVLAYAIIDAVIKLDFNRS